MKRALCFAAAVLFGVCMLAFGFRAAQKAYLTRKYPVAYTAEITRYAESYRLNPYLVLSIVRCESSFHADAVSGAGAIGLMQIMPATGAWIAEETGCAEAYAESALYKPETNIAFGCWYLRYLADLFDGDTKKIVCAYNAGQGSVAKWLADPAYASDGKLVTIPFPETQAYYAHVLTAYGRYTALYPDLFAEDGDALEANEALCYNTVSEEMPCWKSY